MYLGLVAWSDELLLFNNLDRKSIFLLNPRIRQKNRRTTGRANLVL